MTILALDFASTRRSAAIARNDRLIAEAVHGPGVETRPFSLIEEVLESATLGKPGVDRLAISVGPGSYTGIRLAIALAQGWHLATGIPVVALRGMDVLAQAASGLFDGKPCWLAVDAQRNEFAVSELHAGKPPAPIQLAAKDILLERIRQGEIVAGPDLEKALPGSLPLFPTAALAAQLASRLEPSAPETLTPVYLRAAQFVKAPPARAIPPIPS